MQRTKCQLDTGDDWCSACDYSSGTAVCKGCFPRPRNTGTNNPAAITLDATTKRVGGLGGGCGVGVWVGGWVAETHIDTLTPLSWTQRPSHCMGDGRGGSMWNKHGHRYPGCHQGRRLDEADGLVGWAGGWVVLGWFLGGCGGAAGQQAFEARRRLMTPVLICNATPHLPLLPTVHLNLRPSNHRV